MPALLSGSLFVLSVWALFRELQQYDPQAILDSLAAIPAWALLAAVALVAVNYGVLTSYDLLATRFIRQPLPYRQTAMVAIASYAISNSVGFVLLSSSAIRYRFYAKWGLTPGQIAKIIAFCNLSFWIGLFAVGGSVFARAPLPVPSVLNLPFETVQPLGFLFLAIAAVYLILSSMSRRAIEINGWVLPHVPIELSLAQIVAIACDWTVVAGVLYVLLPESLNLDYSHFFSRYLLAQLAGIISNVPAGLGVFETVLLLQLSPPLAADDFLSALLLYRAVYYLLPLLTALGLLAVYELRQRRDRQSNEPSKRR